MVVAKSLPPFDLGKDRELTKSKACHFIQIEMYVKGARQLAPAFFEKVIIHDLMNVLLDEKALDRAHYHQGKYEKSGVFCPDMESNKIMAYDLEKIECEAYVIVWNVITWATNKNIGLMCLNYMGNQEITVKLMWHTAQLFLQHQLQLDDEVDMNSLQEELEVMHQDILRIWDANTLSTMLCG